MRTKRILCVAAALCLLLTLCVSANAEVSEATAAEGTKFAANVYVEGICEKSGEVTLLLKEADSIKYIEQTETDANGKYVFKFPLKQDISPQCTMTVCDSEKRDITSSVKRAEMSGIHVLADVRIKHEEGRAHIDNGDVISAVSVLTNKYLEDTEVSIVLAAYDKEDRLINAQHKSVHVEYKPLNESEVEFDGFEVNADTEKVKVFAWESMSRLIPLGTAASAAKPTNVYLVSHSQCAYYEKNVYYPRMGWGQFLQESFADGVSIKNRARAGWSSKAFLISSKNPKKGDLSTLNDPDNSPWQAVKAELKPGDYVVISHCINDYSQTGYDLFEKAENGDYDYSAEKNKYYRVSGGTGHYKRIYTWTSTVDEYKDNLRRFVNEAREKGAIPIISTDVTQVEQQMNETAQEYYNAMQETAAELGVTYIDVMSPHRNMYLKNIDTFVNKYNITPQSLSDYKSKGEIGSMWTGEAMNTFDNVHLTEAGAKLVAELFVNELKKTDSGLKYYLK